MKKIITILLVSILSAVVVMPVFASDTHANIRADFYMFGGRNNPDATGYAIFNYVKGKDAWNVTGEVYNMRPDNYTISVGIAGTCTGNVELVNFTVGEDGYAYFHAEYKILPDEINIARIYKQGNACQTELTAPEVEGMLIFRGSQRIK